MPLISNKHQGLLQHMWNLVEPNLKLILISQPRPNILNEIKLRTLFIFFQANNFKHWDFWNRDGSMNNKKLIKFISYFQNVWRHNFFQ